MLRLAPNCEPASYRFSKYKGPERGRAHSQFGDGGPAARVVRVLPEGVVCQQLGLVQLPVYGRQVEEQVLYTSFS